MLTAFRVGGFKAPLGQSHANANANAHGSQVTVGRSPAACRSLESGWQLRDNVIDLLYGK